jgi:serpin B
MKRLIFSLFAILVLISTGCKKDDPSPVKEPKQLELPAKANDVITCSNDFGFELFRQTALAEPEKNMMVSPLSASVALTMLLNGCDGNTYDQIRDMLGYEGLTLEEINDTYRSLTSQLLAVDPEVELSLANAVWYHYLFTVKTPFLESMEASFDAHVESLDFHTQAALDAINGWASDNTNGKIPKVLDEISQDAVMFLMNALYFKGDWTWKFDENNTSQETFYMDNGTNKEVDMMSGKVPVRVAKIDGIRAVEMCYGRQNFSIIFLTSMNTVNETLEGMDAAFWEEVTSELDNTPAAETEIVLPKFTFDYEKELNDQLEALGMTDAFNPYLADLSGISDADIYVSFVKQNTFINLDEQGTEAAAVTTIGIEYTALPEQVVINKSFIFAIRERTTNTLLFAGKLMTL